MELKLKREAETARAEAEIIRLQADEDIAHLKSEAEAARLNSEVEVKRTIAAARSDDLDFDQLQQLANSRARKKAASITDKSTRQREAREVALQALGEFNDGLDEFLQDESLSDTIVLNEEFSSLDVQNDNLLDPFAAEEAEPVRVQPELTDEDIEESKPTLESRQWLTDDSVWAETLGLEPDERELESQVAPTIVESAAKQAPAKGSPEKVKAKTVANFSNASNFRTTGPQAQVHPHTAGSERHAKHSRSLRPLMLSLGMLVVAAVGGWAYWQGPENLISQGKQIGAGAQSLLHEWGEQAEAQYQAWFAGEEQQAELNAEQKALEAEEKLARLRERLAEMRDEQAQKKQREEEAALSAARQKAIEEEVARRDAEEVALEIARQKALEEARLEAEREHAEQQAAREESTVTESAVTESTASDSDASSQQ